MSIRIVPTKPHNTQTTPLLSAPSAPGVHDTLRASIAEAPISGIPTTTCTSHTNNSLDSTHPLEARLTAWVSTREQMTSTALRHTYGLAAPIKRAMELNAVRAGSWRPAVLGRLPGGGQSVHEDILMGKETEVAWEDVFGAGEEMRERPSLFSEMVKGARIS
ncbi:hypothetical protein BT63DRAFT_426767 [Microthyrium microscopicum]|uniref:Proteasome maturation factor UMP1 n=1 Tax=Microthyrium microscopicum TaxID=703497 RepID=A0A6A6U9X1_9PEZI|nr:hypothetical protein BT63DRAFT_426767 [Microthyrium microscopicum]